MAIKLCSRLGGVEQCTFRMMGVWCTWTRVFLAVILIPRKYGENKNDSGGTNLVADYYAFFNVLGLSQTLLSLETLVHYSFPYFFTIS